MYRKPRSQPTWWTARLLRVLLGLLPALIPAHGESSVADLVVAGGSITEIVYRLGLHDQLLAVDSTSLYPSEARQLPDIGYLRALSAEPILSLHPATVLLSQDAGPTEVIEQLRAAGLRVVVVPDSPTVDGTLMKIRTVAAALGVETAGEELARAMDGELRSISDRLAMATDRPAVIFLMSVSAGSLLAAGRDTAAAGLIELAGGRNAIDDYAGYRPLSPEALVALAPDAILITTRTLQAVGGADAFWALPQLAGTPAATARRLIVMEDLLALGFGPRLGSAVRELAGHLHPGLMDATAGTDPGRADQPALKP